MYQMSGLKDRITLPDELSQETRGGEPERMPCVVNSSSLECLARLVMLREMTVREYLMHWADLSDMKYRNHSVELLEQMATAKKDRQC